MYQISDVLKIIGVVHSIFKKVRELPLRCKKNISEIEIFEDYIEGLCDIEGFSHIHVFYWLHKSKNYSLKVKTPWEDKLHGLFSTRSPNRPNPLGYSVVKIIDLKDNYIKVKGLDAIDGTPVIDIKPYIKKTDSIKYSSSGWLENLDLD